ncbi:HET-domain-containing protein, partial [Lentithecium fluviatile CBS 122367]
MSIPTSLARYSYPPLRLGEIRVLKLFSVNEASLAFNTPSNQTPPLYGQLTHLRFDENPIYDALSYTWGDPKPTDKLLLRKDDLSSEQLGIAANLTKALQTLRIQDRSLFMWIDAICINQDDLDERSREVQHMHHIYSKAAIVRIWIDVENQPDDETARRLSLLSPHHDTPIKEADTGTRPKVQENSNEHSGDEDIGDRPEVWRSLSGLCKNSYWKRVWIQQEICYAADIFIHCSSASIAGEDFTEFLRQVMKKAENS